MGLVFRTSDLPVGEGFAAWRRAAADLLSVPVVVDTRDPAAFTGELRLAQIGAVQLSVVTTGPFALRRPPSLIRRSDPEEYVVMAALHGRGGLEQGGRQARVGPDHFVVCGSSEPYTGWGEAGGGPAHGLLLTLPRSALPIPERAVARLFARPLSGRAPTAALFLGFLTRLAGCVDQLTPADADRLARALVELLAASLAHELDALTRLEPEPRQRALRARVRAFVDRHLSDPELCPATIAAAHHICVRHLHQIFRGEGVTVAGLIRTARLERCRRDLADPALRHEPVAGIGARWGFVDAPHFSRVFRAAFGLPPGEYRRQRLDRPAA